MIRAVLFDLYDTLVRGDAATTEMARALSIDEQAFQQLFADTAAERMRGDLGGIEQTLKTLATRLGAEPTENGIRLACIVWQRHHHKVLWPSPGTLATLDELREKGMLLGLVTNCSEETVIQWPLQPMASRIDATGFSWELHMLKPEPEIYLQVCRRLGVEPAECLYVGDGADGELRGAKALGMRVVRSLEFANSDLTWVGENIGKLRDVIGLLE